MACLGLMPAQSQRWGSRETPGSSRRTAAPELSILGTSALSVSLRASRVAFRHLCLNGACEAQGIITRLVTPHVGAPNCLSLSLTPPSASAFYHSGNPVISPLIPSEASPPIPAP